jgi:hypothetical protein
MHVATVPNQKNATLHEGKGSKKLVSFLPTRRENLEIVAPHVRAMMAQELTAES